MNKKAFLALFMLATFLFGVTVAFAAVPHKINPVTLQKEQVPDRYRLLNKQGAYTLWEDDFEGTIGWTTDPYDPMPFHTTTKKVCSGDSAWWNGNPKCGYKNSWWQYLDTDPIVVQTGGITLNFNHAWAIEKVTPASDPNTAHEGCDMWDVANVQASVNGGDWVLIQPTTGTAYAGTCSYAYFHHQEDYCRGGWNDLNPSWPNCDASGFALTIGQDIGGDTLAVGDTVVFRFEFVSDPAASGCDGEMAPPHGEGWYIDDIVVTTGGTSYENHGTNSGASLQMHPGYIPFPSSWQVITMPDSTGDPCPSATHCCYISDADTETIAKVSYWVSPWITIPGIDSAAVIWLEWCQDQYVRGTTCPQPENTVLQDYMQIYVRSVDDSNNWQNICYTYDAQMGDYESPADTEHGHWRLAGLDSLTSNYVPFVPELIAPPPDTQTTQVQFRFDYILNAWQDDPENGCQGWIPQPGWGFRMDNVRLRAVKCYDQNLGIVWETEADRPVPFSVPVDTTVPVKLAIASGPTCRSTDLSATVKADIDAPNAYHGEATIPAGFASGDKQIYSLDADFTAQSVDTIWTELTAEMDFTGDANPSDDQLTYRTLITNSDYCRLATYNPFGGGTATDVDSGYGIGVLFVPQYFDPYQLLRIGFIARDSTVCKVHVYPVDSIIDYPSTPWIDSVVVNTAQEWKDDQGHIAAEACTTRPCFDYTYVDLWDADSADDDWENIPGDQAFFVYIEQWPDSGSGPGAAFDTREQVGGYSFVGNPVEGWQNVSDPNQDRIRGNIGDKWRDANFYVNIGAMNYTPPVAGPLFIRGDYDANGQLLTNDPLMELQFIFGVPGATPPSCESAADYNDDGSVLTNDPLMALQYIFGVPGSTAPPAPYPGCGMDPTPDDLTCVSFPFCGTKGATVAYKPSVSVKGAENKLVAEEPQVADGLVRVPIELTVTEPVCGFDISLGYDAGSLRFKEVVGGEGYDFWAVDTRQAGVVRIGGVPDIEMAELLEPGTHLVGEVVFAVGKRADIGLGWKKAEVYGSRVQPLSVEWVSKAGSNLPKEFALSQNYPNPFNPTTIIKYALPVNCQVKLEVYNVVGQKVATLVDGQQKAGYKVVTWNARDMASGVYFYRLTAGNFTSIRKMVLLK